MDGATRVALFTEKSVTFLRAVLLGKLHFSCLTRMPWGTHTLLIVGLSREGSISERTVLGRPFRCHSTTLECKVQVTGGAANRRQINLKSRTTPLKVSCFFHRNHFWNEVTSSVRASRVTELCGATDKRPARERTNPA